MYYPRKGLLLKLQKLNGLVGVAPGEVGTERKADDVLGDLVVVELLEAFGYNFGLFAVSMRCQRRIQTRPRAYLSCFFFLVLLFPLCLFCGIGFEDGEPGVGSQRPHLRCRQKPPGRCR